MSRSFGDRVAKQLGVTCEPEITEHQVTEDDKFLVLGSDGLFEFLSNQEVVKMTAKHWKRREISAAAEELGQRAKREWAAQECGRDDISCIVLFFGHNI